jgi:hypothetical protein
MPVFKIFCTVCHYTGNQFLNIEVSSKVVKCPGCMRGVTARKIKTKGVVEAEADGVVGYLRYDNKRHNNS